MPEPEVTMWEPEATVDEYEDETETPPKTPVSNITTYITKINVTAFSGGRSLKSQFSLQWRNYNGAGGVVAPGHQLQLKNIKITHKQLVCITSNYSNI